MTRTTVSGMLLRHLNVKSKSGFEWLCLCPYHEDTSPSFSVNVHKKLFICYACGAKGTVAQLMEHLGLSERLAEEEISIDELSNKVRSVSEDVSRTSRPPVGIPIPSHFYSSTESIEEYWVSNRKLTPSAVEAYRLGFDELNNEAVIPVRDYNGHTVGLIRRTFDESRPRYLYSKGMKTSEVVFGAHEAFQLTTKNIGKDYVLVITEGAVDAMTVYNMNLKSPKTAIVGVAVLGSRISHQQAQIIKRLGFREIVIATDMDRAGRLARIQIATQLKDVRVGSLIHTATWHEMFGKDLNAIERDKLSNIIESSFNPYGQFISTNPIVSKLK